MNLIGRLICFILRKHKRGKRVAHLAHSAGGPVGGPSDTFRMQCPRCKAKWDRTIKPKPAAPAIPASIRK